MTWHIALVCGIVAAAATAFASETVVVTRSDHGSNHALVIQSGPRDDKPVAQVRKGPGYAVIEQNSNRNRAVIIQGD